MNQSLSFRAKKIKPSLTLAISAAAKKLSLENPKVINLGVGEPDFDTPDEIKDAAFQAISQGFTKYTAVEGILELRKAVAKHLKATLNIQYDPMQIMVSTGAKQCIFNAMQALLNPDDEVLIPVPYWVSYPDMVELCGAKPVFIRSDSYKSFKIGPKDLAAAITPKTKMLIINSPNNPSGMIYSSQELLGLYEILKLHPQIFILSDDIYNAIAWQNLEKTVPHLLSLAPALVNRTLVINGVSKSHAMTGWRIGFVAGPKTIIEAMTSIQSQSTSSPCSISQKAALAAMQSHQLFSSMMTLEYRKRHDYLLNALNELNGVQCQPSDGTFYLLIFVEEAIKAKGLQNDLDFCQAVLKEALVALVPGSAFGIPNYCRISFAASLSTLKAAVEQLTHYLGKSA